MDFKRKRALYEEINDMHRCIEGLLEIIEGMSGKYFGDKSRCAFNMIKESVDFVEYNGCINSLEYIENQIKPKEERD